VLPRVDAGSIEQHGIELAVVPTAATSVVMGSSCYDSPRKRDQSAPFRSGLHRL